MARAPVPSVAYFRSTAVKPEAFFAIPDQAVLDVLEDTTDYVVSFVAKHAKGVITSWDRSFQRAICHIAALDLMAHRGFDRTKGADSEIARRAERANEWLDKVADGRVEPYFVDETPDDADDGVLSGSDSRSDDWTRPGGCGCGVI